MDDDDDAVGIVSVDPVCWDETLVFPLIILILIHFLSPMNLSTPSLSHTVFIRIPMIPSVQYVHRCGRAARTFDPSKAQNKGRTAACVYSFFTRASAPTMGRDVVALLRASKAWIDPKLSALLLEEEIDDTGGAKATTTTID